MKVFSTGLQRTGTMSLTRALNALNIRAKQFPKELYQDINHPIIDEYDAFTDFPIPLIYRELDQAYPGSKFIHTIRDEQQWANSVRWLFTTGSVKFNVAKNSYAQTFHHEFYSTNTFDEGLFLERYRAYNEEVYSYFSERPQDFLVIDLTAGEGFEILCPFLDKEVPDIPFPYANKREGLRKVQVRQLWRRSTKSLRRKWRHSRLKMLVQLGTGIISPLPLTDPKDQLNSRPFFILSSGRSGSTLLRAMLNQHPTICIPPEAHRLGNIVQNFRSRYRYLPWTYLPGLVTAEFQAARGFEYWQIPLAYFHRHARETPKERQNLAYLIDLYYRVYLQNHKPEANRWGDKTFKSARYLPELNALFPQAQYIHLIRDGRDVASSLLNQGVFPNLLAAANHWLEQVELARGFGGNLDAGRFMEIRYEDLIQDTTVSMQKVCDFLAIDFLPDMLEFWRHTDKLGDADRALHENLKHPIKKDAIGGWRRALSPRQQDQVQRRLEQMLTTLGYPVED